MAIEEPTVVLCVRAVTNCLPPAICTTNSHHLFRWSLRAHLFRKAFNFAPAKILFYLSFNDFCPTSWHCSAWLFCWSV